MITFHAIIARKHGETAAYPVIAAFGADGYPAVLAKYNELTGKGGESFREENAELLQFTVDGLSFRIEHHHTFEDPKTVASRREAAALAEALRVREQADAAQATLDAAKDQVAAAKDGLKTLSPDQKKLLAAYDEKVAAAAATAAEPTTDEKAQRKASADEAKRQEQAAKEMAARAEALGIDHTGALIGSTIGGPSAEELDLEEHTIDELKAIASIEHADLTGLTLKADIIAAIELNRTPLEDRTIEQLKDLAAKENIDLTGKSLKADIITAIQTARTAPPPSDLSPPSSGDTGPTL